jgi:hypothetical protein
MPKNTPKTLKLYWSKREQDWMVFYPDLAGKSMRGPVFGMTQTTGRRMDWEQDLKAMLTDRGYDYTTFRITVKN